MHSQDKERPSSYRPRSAPPVVTLPSSLPPVLELEDEVPRFRGESAPLASLSAQVRAASRAEDKAVAAGRLARQLMRRGIELRDALALAERSLSIRSDPELALEVARWWTEAGDPMRGAALASSVAADLPEEARASALLEVGRLHCRTGQVHQAAQALRRVMELSPRDPRPFELFGALGFWAELPKSECARALLMAAALRKTLGDDTESFEDRLRAFEVDPSSGDAARELAAALLRRGRAGAADEILREHLRSGSASARAAHHQRLFYSCLESGELKRAFESALDAELDADVDVLRLHELLIEGAELGADFESFLVRLLHDEELGDGRPFAHWVLALAQMHEGPEEQSLVRRIVWHLSERYELGSFGELVWDDRDAAVRLLRARLAVERDPSEEISLRVDLARYECQQGQFADALAIIEPLLSRDDLPLSVGVMGAALAGRAGQPIARARALSALASFLPGSAAAITYSVAAELLLEGGESDEAHRCADAAVEADPKNERAVASQSLVALRAPDGSSALLLEHSLAVLVARSELCRLLCDAASQRGAANLAQTWAERALALRPGDSECCRQLLVQARATGDGDKVRSALLTVLEQDAPVLALADEVARCLPQLAELPRPELSLAAHRVLSRFHLRDEGLSAALRELAEQRELHELTARLLELELVGSGSQRRASLYAGLVQARLLSGNGVAAARALRRLQLSGGTAEQVLPFLPQFAAGLEADALLPLFELRAEFEESEVEFETRSARLFHAGAARWDMAQDSQGALQYWLRAAEEDPRRGLELFAHYLRRFAGSEGAYRHFKEAATQTENPTRSGRLLGFAARELLLMGRQEEAFEVAQTALERAPMLTDILAIAEATAAREDVSVMDQLYELVARASLGSFGERAVHYRAARQLEKRGDLQRALDHACAAFEAVPAEGVSFVLMARLADATLGHSKLIASIQRVADHAPSDAERSRWLARGASLADSEGVGRHERMELLWRAAQMLPERETLDALFDSLAHRLADEPEARDELWSRFEKLASGLAAHAGDGQGAELYVHFASVALSHFDQPGPALDWISRAVELNAELEEYRRLLPFATQIAGLAGPCIEFLDQLRERIGGERRAFGLGLAELAGKLAELLDEKDVAAEILVCAAVSFPDQTSLTNWSLRAVTAAERRDLRIVLDGLLPAEQRARQLLQRLGSLEPARALDELSALDLDALPEDLKIEALLARARAQEDAGALERAARDYEAVLAIDPSDSLALCGVERECERSGRHEELAQVLGRRIELSADPGEVRRLSLRLAAVLETRLGRAEEARDVLGRLLAQEEDRAALRMLADSWQRSGDATEAAELWQRVRKITDDPQEADDASSRAAECYREAGRVAKALEQLELIESPSLQHRRLALELAIESEDQAAQLEHLRLLTETAGVEREELSELLHRATQLALELAKPEDALSFAERALSLFDSAANSFKPESRLLVVRLRVQLHGVPEATESRQLRARLPGVSELSAAADQEMALFLKTQLTRAVEGADAARELLRQAPASLSSSPLLRVLLAELHDQDAQSALQHYESALDSDLQGFYRRAELLLAAGLAAQLCGDFDRARALISAVPDDDPLRVRAAKELEELARAHARQKRLARESRKRRDEESSERKSSATSPSKSLGEVPASSGSGEQAALGEPPEASTSKHLVSPPLESNEALEPDSAEAEAPVPSAEPEGEQEDPGASGAEAPEGLESKWIVALEQGDLQAGLRLLERLEGDRTRSRDAIVVASHLASLDPSDGGLLGRLVTIATKDGNQPLALAVRHILGAYGAGDPVAAPPMTPRRGDQRAGMNLVQQVHLPAHEALALVWEHAGALYRKDLNHYGISGIERVPHHAPTPLATLYAQAARLLDLMRTPLFGSGGEDDISIRVALLQPPAVLVTGKVETVTKELEFHFGAMLAAASPAHALVFSVAPEEMQDLLDALLLSFGSGGSSAGRPSPRVRRVASFFWETIPPRAQRRLSQLCAEADHFETQLIANASRYALRRAGLLVCGDLSIAVDEACAELGLPPPRTLQELALASQRAPSVSDLLSFALSPEYAQMRYSVD